MQSGLKYIKLFEDQNLTSRFLDTFPDTLNDVYWRMPEVAFAVWKHLAHDTGQIGKLIQLGLFDESNVNQARVRRLPGIDRIVCIYGGKIKETAEKADLLNQMCDSIVTGIPGGRDPNHYEIHLDEDHLVDREYLETVSLSPGGNNKLIRCKTLSGVPLMIVERMSWMIFLNVDDLDKMQPWN
jgi:hypothetical protein